VSAPSPTNRPIADRVGAAAAAIAQMPGVGPLQMKPGVVQALLQQTPSTQKSERHWLGVTHSPPFGIFVCVGVALVVAVAVLVRVTVPVLVAVRVAVFVLVAVRVAVFVRVAVPVAVAVFVPVRVLVAVLVRVAVPVLVKV
jgi:hypothetical protein